MAHSLVYHGLIRALLSLALIASLGEFVLFSMIFFKMKGHFKLISHLDPSPKMWGFFLSSSCPYFSIFGLFQKKIRRLFETYFFQKIPGIFRFAILSLEILEKAKLHLRKFHKIVLQPLGISRPETKTHGNSTWFFFDKVKIPLFYLIPEIFICSSIPLEIPCSHSLFFFSGIAYNTCK